MKQITQIALLSVTLLGFLAFGNPTLSAENQSNSDTSTSQGQRIEKQNKNSLRILNLHKSWIRNREKTAKQQQQKDASEKQTSEHPSADTITIDTPPAVVPRGLQTPKLPPLFYADIHHEGNRKRMAVGVQTKEGSIFTGLIGTEISEEGYSTSIGVNGEMAVEVQTEEGFIFTGLIGTEISEEGYSTNIGVSAKFDLDTVPSFFSRTRDVLLFVPKKIGVGFTYLGRGIKYLLW